MYLPDRFPEREIRKLNMSFPGAIVDGGFRDLGFRVLGFRAW